MDVVRTIGNHHLILLVIDLVDPRRRSRIGMVGVGVTGLGAAVFSIDVMTRSLTGASAPGLAMATVTASPEIRASLPSSTASALKRNNFTSPSTVTSTAPGPDTATERHHVAGVRVRHREAPRSSYDVGHTDCAARSTSTRPCPWKCLLAAEISGGVAENLLHTFGLTNQFWVPRHENCRRASDVQPSLAGAVE